MPVSRRLLAAGVIGLAVVGVGGAGISVATADDEIPKGVRVEGIDLGGLDRAAAEARLTEGLRERATAPLPLEAAGEELVLQPERSGLSVDVAATATEALSASPAARIRAVFGVGREVEPVVAVDETELAAALKALAPKVDREPKEGAVRFTSEPVPVAAQPQTGRTLDVDGSVEAVRAGWLSEQRVELPVDIEEVQTTPEEVKTALEEVAVPAIAARVTVDVAGDPLKVEPLDIAKALRIEVDDQGELTPRLLPDVLYEQVREGLRRVGSPPKDATFDVSSGKPVVVPSKGGMSVSPADLAAAVMSVLTDAAPRRASAGLSPVEARITTAKAATLGVKEVIGSFTTRHPCCRPRVENIHRIADIVDGAVLLPGDRFDLNEFVGPRDKARGFKEAPQILEGEFVDRVGGGVSQFATTLFNAVFFSGLEDITHSPHSYYISRYPPGREATVSFPLPDLIFENDSKHGVLIKTSYTGTSITVTFWGTKRFDEVRSVTGPRTRIRDFDTQYVDRPDCTATEGEKGFDIVVTRVFVDGGKVVDREPFRTRYKPEPKFICGKDPKTRRAGGSGSGSTGSGSRGGGSTGSGSAGTSSGPPPSPASG